MEIKIKQSAAKQERRLKTLLVSEELMLSMLLCMLDRQPKYLSVPDLVDIPKDVEIVRVGYMYEHMAFGFLLAHKTFDPVSEGSPIPTMSGRCEDKVFEVVQNEKN